VAQLKWLGSALLRMSEPWPLGDAGIPRERLDGAKEDYTSVVRRIGLTSLASPRSLYDRGMKPKFGAAPAKKQACSL
jgi:hypothetical protein